MRPDCVPFNGHLTKAQDMFCLQIKTLISIFCLLIASFLFTWLKFPIARVLLKCWTQIYAICILEKTDLLPYNAGTETSKTEVQERLPSEE